jgi:hypothetical protein
VNSPISKNSTTNQEGQGIIKYASIPRASRKLPITAAGSCGFHDFQSAFWPALQHFVGVGGLESWNAIQLLHTMFALYKELTTRWKKIVRAVWKKVCGT